MAENKGYMTLSDEQGSIHISEEVIAAIAVGAVREVEGVSGMMGNLGTSVADLVTNKKGAQKNAKGVKIEMTETGLVLDIYLTVAYGHAIPEVAENAQKAVASAVSVIGNEPSPPKRPISVSSVRVTVTSSLSWMRPVADHRMSGSSPVLSVSAAARRVVSVPTRPAISASRTSSTA